MDCKQKQPQKGLDGFAVILGANWNNGANAGSRSANWNNSPSNSNNNIGGRGVCDIKGFMLRHREVSGRPGGQPFKPASANTLMGFAIGASRA